MWQLDDYWIVRKSDLDQAKAGHVESPHLITPQIGRWLADGLLEGMLADLQSEMDLGVNKRYVCARLTEAFERQELLALCDAPFLPARDLQASASTDSGRLTAALSLGRVIRGCLPVYNDAMDAQFDDGDIEDAVEEPAKENWIYVQHTRPRPGSLDPETREPTAPEPVLSTAHIYEAGTENEVAQAKMSADGKPVKVSVPVGMANFDVVFDNDFGGEYKIEHEPYPNPFTDKTPEPTEAQKAQLVNMRLV